MRMKPHEAWAVLAGVIHRAGVPYSQAVALVETLAPTNLTLAQIVAMTDLIRAVTRAIREEGEQPR